MQCCIKHSSQNMYIEQSISSLTSTGMYNITVLLVSGKKSDILIPVPLQTASPTTGQCSQHDYGIFNFGYYMRYSRKWCCVEILVHIVNCASH